MEGVGLLELGRVAGALQHLEPGAGDAIAHERAVLGCARPVVASLDDEGRHRDLVEALERPRAGVRPRRLDRGLVSRPVGDPPIPLERGARGRLPEEAGEGGAPMSASSRVRIRLSARSATV